MATLDDSGRLLEPPHGRLDARAHRAARAPDEERLTDAAPRTLDARLAGRALARGGGGAWLALLAGDGAAGALILGAALGGTAFVERLALTWARRGAGRWRAAAAASAASAALVVATAAHLVALHDAGSVGFDAGATSMAVALGAIAKLGLLGVLTVGGAVLVLSMPAGASLLMDLAEEDGPGERASTWLVGGATLAGLLPTLVALGGLPVGVQASETSLPGVLISLVVGFPIAFVGAAALEVGLLLVLLVVDALGDVAARLVGPAGTT